MLSDLLSTPVSIVANLPQLVPGQYHQLISLGDLRSASSPLDRNVDTYFQTVEKIADGYAPVRSPFMRPVHLHQAASLQVGALLHEDGTSYLASQAAVPQQLGFMLGPSVETASTTLETALPELRFRRSYPALRQFLSDPILRTLQQFPVTTLLAPGGEIVLIPQFELARAFYFWVGAKFIDFLFHPTRTSHICDPIQAPRPDNKWAGKVLLRPNRLDPANVFDLDARFSPEQVILLAQMRFSTPFRRSIEQLCARQALAASKGATAPLALDLAISRRVAVRANGIPFTHREQAYFWVCSIFERGNYFCFDDLHYTTLLDSKLSGRSATGTVPVPSPQTGVVTHLNLHNQPRQDSNQPGSSAYGGAEVLLPSGEKLQLPSVHRNAKAVEQALCGGRRGHRQGLPEVLTQRAGGNDLAIAKVNLRPAWESLDSHQYFDTLVAEFRRAGYRVSRLQLNNAHSRYGRGFSVPAGMAAGDPLYQVGVARIQRLLGQKAVHCYFFHVLYSRSRRSAFIYRTDLNALDEQQINWLLKEIKRWNDDWRKTREEYEARWKRKVADLLQEGIRLPLALHARNRKSALQVVELCLKEFERELNLG